MKSFRETFYDLLRAEKAKNGTWTKSFTWRQVMDVYDSAVQMVGISDMPGCVAHGFCPGCVQDENDKNSDLMKAQLVELMEAINDLGRSEDRDNGPAATGDPRTS